MGRAPCCDKANVKKGPWSPEEDATLKSYIEKHGTGGNWIALPQKIGLKRCGKSCRLRWLNYLRPNIKHGGFTEDEDNLICSLYRSIGSRWSIIAAQLPGRTDNDIKNYWNTKLKKKLLGKQRREQAAKRGSFKARLLEDQSTANRCNNCSINDSFQLYPWPQPPQPAATPSSRLTSHASDPTPLKDTLIVPQTQFIDNSDNFEAFSHFTSSEDQLNSSARPSFIDSDFDDINGLAPNNFHSLQGIQENMIYSMPQELNLDCSFSVVDAVSPESSTIFGADISSLVYASSSLPSYEACNQNLSTLFDEPRLLGFS